MYEALLIDGDRIHAMQMLRRLDSRSLRAHIIRDVEQAALALRSSSTPFRIVIVNVSDAAQPWLRNLEDLQDAACIGGRFSPPQFLCVSTRRYEPRFELEIERRGARYVFDR